MIFTAELEGTGGSTTGFVVPEEVLVALDGGRRPKVTVTLGSHTWRSSIASMGGRFMLGVSMANRETAGATAGQTYDVEVVLDTAPRAVDVPEDLAAALSADPRARAAWDALSFSHQRRHAEAVLAAKKPETRARRVATTVEALTATA